MEIKPGRMRMLRLTCFILATTVLLAPPQPAAAQRSDDLLQKLGDTDEFEVRSLIGHMRSRRSYNEPDFKNDKYVYIDWPDLRSSELTAECNYRGTPHPGFNPYPGTNGPGMTICRCDLGYTGPSCELTTEDYGPFTPCEDDTDCEYGLVCEQQWYTRSMFLNDLTPGKRCSCPAVAGAGTGAQAVPDPDIHTACQGELPGLQGIKCKYSGCGEGFRCVVFDSSVTRDFDFGVCMCEANSPAPRCQTCSGTVPVSGASQQVQCAPSPTDSAVCVPANGLSDNSSPCHTVKQTEIQGPNERASCPSGTVRSSASGGGCVRQWMPSNSCGWRYWRC